MLTETETKCLFDIFKCRLKSQIEVIAMGGYRLSKPVASCVWWNDYNLGPIDHLDFESCVKQIKEYSLFKKGVITPDFDAEEMLISETAKEINHSLRAEALVNKWAKRP